MTSLPKAPGPRVVILKSDRLYGELISRQVKDLWRQADVQVFHLGFDALDAIQAHAPDLLISGVKLADMDGVEHLEPFISTTLPILVVTSRRDVRTFDLLRSVRFDGIYDGQAEGMTNLPTALEQVLHRRLYFSQSMIEGLKAPRRITLDELTETEQMVLSIIGDGSDDQQAGDRLRISWHTVKSHRRSIMAKLKLHHKGELVLYALQNGYIWVTADQLQYPGFQRELLARRKMDRKVQANA